MDFANPIHRDALASLEEYEDNGHQQGYSVIEGDKDAGQEHSDVESGEVDDTEFYNNNNWDTDDKDTEAKDVDEPNKDSGNETADEDSNEIQSPQTPQRVQAHQAHTPETPRKAPSLEDDIQMINQAFKEKTPGGKYKKLTDILLYRDADHIDKIREGFKSLSGSSSNKDLIKTISKRPTLGGNKSDAPINNALEALVYGPRLSDVFWVHTAIYGVGTFEDLLDQAILGKRPREVHALKAPYKVFSGKSLIDDIKGDLSGNVDYFYEELLKEAELEYLNKRPDPPDLPKLAKDLYNKFIKSREREFLQSFVQVAPSSLPDLSDCFRINHSEELREVLERFFSGHLKKALLWRFDVAVKAKDSEDGQTIPEITLHQHLKTARSTSNQAVRTLMKNTKNEWDLVLVSNLLRIHWEGNMGEVKKRYYTSFGKELDDVVEAVLEGTETPFREFCLRLIQFDPLAEV